MSEESPYRCLTTSIPLEDGGGYVASFPDIPGCLGVGDTPEEAVSDAQQALLACLDALRAVDRAPPIPSAPTA